MLTLDRLRRGSEARQYAVSVEAQIDRARMGAGQREIDKVLLPRGRAEMDSPENLAAKAAEFVAGAN